MKFNATTKIPPDIYIVPCRDESHCCTQPRFGNVSVLAPVDVDVSSDVVQWDHFFRASLRQRDMLPDATWSPIDIADGLWCFARRMTEGDYVIVSSRRHIRVGRITGPIDSVIDRKSALTRYYRKVRWLTRDSISMSALSSRLRLTIKSASACFEAECLRREVADALRNHRGSQRCQSEAADRRARLRSVHAGLMTSQIGRKGLENLVRLTLCCEFRSKHETILYNDGECLEMIISGGCFGVRAQRVFVSLSLKCGGLALTEDSLRRIAEQMREFGIGFGIMGVVSSISEWVHEEVVHAQELSDVRFLLLEGNDLAAMVVDSGLEKFILGRKGV